MSWYGIEAVDRAFSRTRKALFEPFDFWKWTKLAIIIFLLGGAASNYGGSTNYTTGSIDSGDNFPFIEPGKMPDLPFGMHDTAFGYIYPVPQLATVVAVIIFFLLLALVFSYISSVMEFVFVESLVKNEVKFWAYSRRFLRKGFYLLLVRLALGLVFLVLFVLAVLPFILVILEDSSEFAWPARLGGILWLAGSFVILVLLAVAINSLLSLAIPVSIYRSEGILPAFRMIYGNFRKSWQEVVVYWLIRFALGIGTGIIAIFIFGLVMLVLGLGSLIFDGILYFLLSSFISEPYIWILLIPFIVIELILILGALVFLNVPLAVFIRYHLLSFLEAWFADVEIPFFDAPALEPESGFSESEPGF